MNKPAINPNDLNNQWSVVRLGVVSVACSVFALCLGAICVVRYSVGDPTMSLENLEYAFTTMVIAAASTLCGLAGTVIGVLGWRRTKQHRSVVCTVGVVLNTLVIAVLWLLIAASPY